MGEASPKRLKKMRVTNWRRRKEVVGGDGGQRLVERHRRLSSKEKKTYEGDETEESDGLGDLSLGCRGEWASG